MTGKTWNVPVNFVIPKLKEYYDMWATCFYKCMMNLPLTEEEQKFVDSLQNYED